MNYPQDLSKIRHVRPLDPVSAPITSEPTRALELRLKALEAAVYGSQSASNNTQLIIYNAPINTASPNAVGLYSVVYYNPNTNLYEPAAATVTLVSGTFTANPSALAVGVVIALNGSVANILIGGAMAWGNEPGSTAMQNALIVEGAGGFSPGAVYYLSDTNPGQVTQYPPSLKIQVLVAADTTFTVDTQYATPEAIQNVYTLPVGTQPVGAVRSIPPAQNQSIVVGFDALEQFDTVNNQWQLTADGTVSTFVNYGYMIADAVVTTEPSSPIYIRIEVDTSGNINIYSAVTLANLYDSGTIFNQLTGGSALLALTSGNFGTVRNYVVRDNMNNQLGTLMFKFTAYDVSLARHVIFKFPKNFQGWKAVNAPIAPYATVYISNSGSITGVVVVEGSIGYTTPPTVTITDSSLIGSGATATAVINEFGTITGVTVTAPGTGYETPVVTFTNTVSTIQVLNGGSGATATAIVVGGVITGVTVTAEGSGYYLSPTLTIVDPLGVGVGAKIITEVLNGKVIGCSIVNGGSGYSSSTLPVLQIVNQFNSGYDNGISHSAPVTAVINQTPATTPTLTPVYAPASILRVVVQCSGISYNDGTTVTISPNFGAVLHPVIDDVGHITRVDVVNPGTGFTSVPTLTLANVTDGGLVGNGAQLLAILSSAVESVTVTTPGSGLTDPATAVIGVPVKYIEVEISGSGYLTAPTVTLDPPDTAGVPVASGGVQAAATALLGGTVQRVVITNAGSGYSQSAPPTVSVTGGGGTGAILALAIGSDGTIQDVEIINGGYGYTSTPTATLSSVLGGAAITIYLEGNMLGEVVGFDITNAGAGYVSGSATIAVSGGSPTTAAVLTPIVSNDGNGSILGVTIVNPGAGYTSAPTLVVSNPTTGSNVATITAFLDGNAVVGFTISNAGNGYFTPPNVTVAAPPFGTTAIASAKLVGGTAQLCVGLNGAGGMRMAQAAPLSQGNNLQISDYVDDNPTVSKPTNAAWYYNIKADPNLLALYPAVPVNKLIFTFNGSSLVITTYNAATNSVTDLDGDVAVTPVTLLWTTFDTDGCPWDASVQQYVNDVGATGRDCIISGTGPGTFTAAFWKLWEQVFKYEVQRNRAWVDLNKASQFYQTGRVESLAALSPLRLIDTVTGAQSSDNGLPMTGQLMIVSDADDAFFNGTGAQITLTNPGELQAIFQNQTGRLVAITSFLLTVVFQTNANNLAPNASYAAQVTIGTEAGNYQDIVGSSTADVASTCLYAVNQVKQIFPDPDQPSPLIQPNGIVYLRVVQPAGAPISVQTAVAYIRGNVL